MKRSHIFCVLSLMLFYVDIYPILAQAPTTAKITFMTARNGNRDIYLMNPDGSKMERITRHRAMDVDPKWSPTGEQILFESDRDRFPFSWDLYLMDADGSNVRRIFAKSMDRSGADWSPGRRTDCLHTLGAREIFHLHRSNRWEKRGAYGNWKSTFMVPRTARR